MTKTGLIVRISCALRGHDYDMEFPNKGSLVCQFVCKYCGHTENDMKDAIKKQRRIE